VGIAPGASIYAVKVLDYNGDGYTSDIIEGIQWAISHDMDIINLSLGSFTSNTTLEAVVNQAYSQGILVVAAAGNDGPGVGIAYPARYASVIAVGATDINNNIAEFSCTGSDLEVAAPGVSIYSTYFTGSYITLSGTSMACPYVCGDLALLKQANPTYTNVQLRELLDKTTVDLGATGRDSQFGYGLIQAPLDKYYAVNFNTNGGTAVSSIYAKQNSAITAPANPTKTDYTFQGWYKEPECINEWNFSTDTVTGDITLYAKWKCYFDGDGTQESPFLIKTADDLSQLAVYVNANNTNFNNKYYRLENDISLSGVSNWTPIGKSSSYKFSGIFDGNNYKMTVLTLTASPTSTSYYGLFGYNNGTIKNLEIADCNITVSGLYGTAAR
jgi:uncharacterized repeat protein (TIGR02543 family)